MAGRTIPDVWPPCLGAAAGLIADALTPHAGNDNELERLSEQVAPTAHLAWVGKRAGVFEGTDADPAVLAYTAVVTQVRHLRSAASKTVFDGRDRAWAETVTAVETCLAALGTPPGCATLPAPDLSPLAGVIAAQRDAETAVKAFNAARVAAQAPNRPAAVAGLLVGIVVGLVGWPVVAAVVGAGPSGPYTAGGSPLGLFELWWVWLACVAGGAFVGFHLGGAVGRPGR